MKIRTWTCPVCGFKTQGHYDGEKQMFIHMREHIIVSEED